MRLQWRRFYARWAPELALGLLAAALVVYLTLVRLSNLFAIVPQAERQRLIRQSTGPIHIGCERATYGWPNYFWNGVRLAVQEINEGIATPGVRGVRLQSGSIRPLQLSDAEALPVRAYAENDPVAIALLQDRELLALIDNLPPFWARRCSATCEMAGVLDISVRASSSGQEDGFKSTVTTCPLQDSLVLGTIRALPQVLRGVLGLELRHPGLVYEEGAGSEGWNSATVVAEVTWQSQLEGALKVLTEASQARTVLPQETLGALVERSAFPSQKLRLLEDLAVRLNPQSPKAVTVQEMRAVLGSQSRVYPLVYSRGYVTSDFEPAHLITEIRMAHCDHLVIVDSSWARAVAIIKQVRQAGLDLPVIVSDYPDVERIARELGPSSGHIFTLLPRDMTPQNKAFRAFAERYQAFVKQSGEAMHPPGVMSLEGYEAVYLLKSALENVASVEPLQVAEVLCQSVKPWPAKVAGETQLDEQGNLQGNPWFPAHIYQGQIQVLPSVNRSVMLH